MTSRLAIVGSGATGFVAERLLSKASPGIRLDVFHGGTEKPAHRLASVDQAGWSRDDLAELHKDIRRECGFKFPPPKSHFGEIVPKHVVRGDRTVWQSRQPGGLTRYWSASLLPFTSAELADWGFDASDFDKHYRWVADEVGLAARKDDLDRYFGHSFASRPPITPTRLIATLVDTIERKAESGIVAGLKLRSKHGPGTVANVCAAAVASTVASGGPFSTARTPACPHPVRPSTFTRKCCAHAP
jgi:hypothetical protein